jgi:hypothetical protein
MFTLIFFAVILISLLIIKKNNSFLVKCRIIVKSFQYRITLVLVGGGMLFFILIYIKNDKEGFYYGLGCDFCSCKLPYDVSPEMDNYGGFTLNDNTGFPIIGGGFSFNRSDLKIRNILAYYYDDSSLICKVSDTTGNDKYLSMYVYKKMNQSVFGFKEVDKSQIQGLSYKNRWFLLNKEYSDNVYLKKKIAVIGIAVSILLIYAVIRSRVITA